tara:strand:+ start:3481 stop:3720 length:240 start_codon:yes stop_codon:yes gene_type:complete
MSKRSFKEWWSNLKEDVKSGLAYEKKQLATYFSSGWGPRIGKGKTIYEIQAIMDKLEKERRAEKKAIKAKRILNSNASN